MRSGLQQIQAVLAQVSRPQPPCAPLGGQILRSFEIEGRSREGYLGVTCLADVSPPCFPRDAFCAPAVRVNRPAVSVNLSDSGAIASPELPVPPSLDPPMDLSAESSLNSDEGFTAEALATLFAQAETQAVPPVAAATAIASSHHFPEHQSPEHRPVEAGPLPTLPRAKSPRLSSHQNHTNPMLPLGLLQDIAKEVMRWQESLAQVHQSIQDLYQDGPIIEGWLEAHPTRPGQYQLCGLDPAGQSWRRPCEPDQLPAASLAISRYKQLRQLLGDKQQLEQRIQRLSETLTMLRGHLRAY